MPFNTGSLTPETFIGLGTGLLSGGTWNEQLANAGTGAITAINAQKEKQQQQLQLKTTAQYLQDKDPMLAAMVLNGSKTPAQAYDDYLKAQAEKAKAARPDYQFMDVNGKIVRVDKNSGSFNQLADYSTPKLPAIADEYNWAKDNGFNGTPQEYQAWKANLSKQKGMTVSYDPINGFQMTQGDVDPAKMPKLTEAEARNSGFYLRAKQSEDVLNSVVNEGTSLWNKAANAVPVLGNYAKSADAQKYDQAKRDFVNAVLRRESGAVISPSEFDNAEKQYFPQPGDDPQTIEQKRLNRESAIAGMKIGAGPGGDKVDSSSQTQPIPAEDYFK